MQPREHCTEPLVECSISGTLTDPVALFSHTLIESLVDRAKSLLSLVRGLPHIVPLAIFGRVVVVPLAAEPRTWERVWALRRLLWLRRLQLSLLVLPVLVLS